MFIDSLFNIIIIMIPLAIFIGRAVVQARSKHNPPPPAPTPPPIHFEEEEEEEYFHAIHMREEQGHFHAAHLREAPEPPQKPLPAPAPVQKRPLGGEMPSLGAAFSSLTPVQPVISPKIPAEPVFNLAHLSQMQQAVVMAEVLGPPKASQ